MERRRPIADGFMLAKAGYAVQIVRKEVPGGENRKSAQYEYVIEYGEKVE